MPPRTNKSGKGEPMAAMAAGGESESWMAAKENQLAIFAKFLACPQLAEELRTRWGVSLEDLDEETACSPEVYAHFSTFLCDHYTIEKGRRNAGQHLNAKSAVAVWSGVLNQAHTMWYTKASAENKVPARPSPCQIGQPTRYARAAAAWPAICPCTCVLVTMLTYAPRCVLQVFFDCLTIDTSPHAHWMNDIKSKMKRTIFQRGMLNAVPMDQSARPLYLADVQAVCKAYSKANTLEAAQRKFAVKTGWRACGRTNEPSFLNYDSLMHDKLLDSPVIELLQSKSSKMKHSIFVAAPHRHACWLVDFGDVLVLDCGKTLYNTGEPCWLLPDLQSGAGSKLSTYVKAIQKSGNGALQRYAHVAIDSLPIDPTAAGLRPGACDTIAMHVPAEIAVHTTGHDLTGLSALWEY